MEMIHFITAKFLQEKYDAEYFAIIDINDKIKKFFKTQKLVDFKKVWYYRDSSIKNTRTYDLSFLKNFEKKYNLHFADLVYSERYFFKYNQYHKFSQKEIFSILQHDCQFFENILDELQPDFLLIKNTDYHQNHLLYQICKSKGIHILYLAGSRFGSRELITSEPETIDSFDELKENKISKIKSYDELSEHVKNYSKEQHDFVTNFQMSQIDRLKNGLKFLLFVTNSRYRKYFAHTGRTKFNVIKNELTLLLKTGYRWRFLNKHTIKNLPEGSNFVYFPLHLEPERVLLIGAPYYTNQLETIIHIAKSLPIDLKLFVKEHPSQRLAGWRSISYYKQILELFNVELLHPSIPNDEVIKKSSLVITISGTSGLEASFYQKPSIILSDVIYSELKSVKRVRNIEELPNAISDALEIKFSIEDLNNYVSKIENSTFNFDHESITLKIHNTFYNNGFLVDTEIPISKMENFLLEIKPYFSELVDSHIQKIQIYKQIEIDKK